MPYTDPDMSPIALHLMASLDEAANLKLYEPLSKGLHGTLGCCGSVSTATTAAYASPNSGPSSGCRPSLFARVALGRRQDVWAQGDDWQAHSIHTSWWAHKLFLCSQGPDKTHGTFGSRYWLRADTQDIGVGGRKILLARGHGFPQLAKEKWGMLGSWHSLRKGQFFLPQHHAYNRGFHFLFYHLHQPSWLAPQY